MPLRQRLCKCGRTYTAQGIARLPGYGDLRRAPNVQISAFISSNIVISSVWARWVGVAVDKGFRVCEVEGFE